jgi:CMP-N-acetylneuraminic acid synthetase
VKTLGIIPARGGSKRVPRKNVRPLGGKPLVAWAIEAATAARLDRVVVSSDDDEVLAIAGRFDPRLPLRRPAELATDTSPAVDYVRHALEACGDHDAVVIVQPSSPLTLPADIDATVELLERSGADTAVTVMELDHAIHPIKLKVLSGDRLLPYLEEERGRMAAHELPKLYVRNCSVYATRASVVAAGAIIGADCRAVVMPRERSIDINDELDFSFAEFLVSRR